MKVSRIVVRALVAVSIALSLSGCVGVMTPPSYHEDAFVGTWVNGETTLELHDDGSFDLTSAPEYTLFTSDADWHTDHATREGHGSWSLSLDTIRLDNQDANAGEQLFIFSQAGETVLSWGIDNGSDDPRCFELAREGSSYTPQGPDQCASYG